MRDARRRLALLLVTLVFFTSPARPADAPRRPPNVIVVLIDDVGYGDFHCTGNPIVQTPNIDRLYVEGVRLTDFHVAPMCTPTRGQLLTGMHCLRNGAMNVSSGRALLRRGIPTLADMFGAAGYRCGQFGKWHLGDNYPYRPQDRGFHESVWYPSSHIGSAPDYFDNDYFDDVYNHNGRRERFKGYTTDVFFTQAIDWMREQSKTGRPFFCYLATAAAHAPFYVPQRYREPYKAQGKIADSFFGMIANIDENLGRLESFLGENHLRDDTVLVFLSDNGGTVGVKLFNAGMRGGKTTLWEGGHRDPCFVRFPAGQLTGGRDVAELTQVQDLAPTLLQLCGVSAPANASFDGVSLVDLLSGKSQSLPDRMLVVSFSRMNAPVPTKEGSAVLWQRWRYFGSGELYDLNTDPHQDRNVIDAHPDVASKMRAYLDEWWKGVEPKLNAHEAIVIDSDAEDPTQLSPADWEDVFFDQGKQVRDGVRKNGAWNVEFAREGRYRFELRRWPREAGAPIAAALPGAKNADGAFPPGVALPVKSARIKIAEFDESHDVKTDDNFASFEPTLKPGRTKLQTWFNDADGKEICGAYYVYVMRVDAP
jgi:arylsulfatase